MWTIPLRHNARVTIIATPTHTNIMIHPPMWWRLHLHNNIIQVLATGVEMMCWRAYAGLADERFKSDIEEARVMTKVD